MVFKELEIQGFKSFPDKVKIRFDEGVTGVVGPNGSGKSNLSDAVRWVLGETSTRQLRAAGKMEDVIFGGTRRRGAMGFAQVRLTLDNSAHTLDLDADEVTIGRKYYRSGESEYSINGQVCRLRDVYELLLICSVMLRISPFRRSTVMVSCCACIRISSASASAALVSRSNRS